MYRWHLRVGGLGSVVAQAVAATTPAPMEFVGLEFYAESGQADELLAKYGLTAEAIVAAAHRALARKR